jgi:AraC-like DNA-binding protein
MDYLLTKADMDLYYCMVRYGLVEFMKKTVSENFIPKIFYCGLEKCSPSWRLQPHSLDKYNITYIIKGNARYTVNKKIYELGPGDLLYLAEGAEIEAITYPKNPMHCFSVNYKSLFTVTNPLPTKIENIGIRKELVELFREMTLSWASKHDGYIMKTRALLMLILHRLNEILIFKIDSMTRDYRINKITHFIAMNYSDKLTVKDLAKLVNLNRAYLGRLFKQQTGATIDQYIKQIRIQSAENMLQSGNFKIHQVAEQCGFSDPIHFYKLFREMRGFPPSRCKPNKR